MPGITSTQCKVSEIHASLIELSGQKPLFPWLYQTLKCSGLVEYSALVTPAGAPAENTTAGTHRLPLCHGAEITPSEPPVSSPTSGNRRPAPSRSSPVRCDPARAFRPTFLSRRAASESRAQRLLGPAYGFIIKGTAWCCCGWLLWWLCALGLRSWISPVSITSAVSMLG